MNIIKPIQAIKGVLDKIKVENGQLISCIDTKEIFIDSYDNKRIKISDIIFLETELEKSSILAPLINKLYFVKENNKIYTFSGSRWNEIFMSNGEGSYSQNISIKKQTITLKSDVDYITVDNFNPINDTILIYCNSIYLEEGNDYRIEVDKIYPTEGKWVATEDQNSCINIIVFKSVVTSNESGTSNYVNEMNNLKRDNAMLLYILMENNITSIKTILTVEKIKSLYISSLWTLEMVTEAKNKTIITEEEFNSISSSKTL